MKQSDDDLYWKLHSLSKSLEGSGRIDEHSNPEAYSVILDAMNALRRQPAVEPVAYIHMPKYSIDGKVRPVVSFERYEDDYAADIYSERIPLFTAPQAQQPAVEPVDIEELAHSALQEALSYGLGLDLFVRYFKLAQKSAAPQPQPAVKPTPQAMQTLIAAMQADPDYAWTWHCNIAMAYVDAGGNHYTGNQGAARFMKLLANVDPAHELPAPQAQQPQQSQE